MKKFLLLILVFSAAIANAQTPIQQAKTYIDANIVNNTGRTITGQKMNTAYNKIIDAMKYLDSLIGTIPGGTAGGSDSTYWSALDSGAVTAKPGRYKFLNSIQVGNYGTSSLITSSIHTNGNILAQKGFTIASAGAADVLNGWYPVPGNLNSIRAMAGNNEILRISLVGSGIGSMFKMTGSFQGVSGGGVANSMDISSYVLSTGANSIDYTQLNIAPAYQQNDLGTGILRGIYYHPAVNSLNTSPHIAYENLSGDIIHRNLSGPGTEMVVVDDTGKLGRQAIPSSSGSDDLNTVMSRNYLTGYPLQKDDNNETVVMNAPGNSVLIVDANNGLQAQDNAENPSANFNTRVLKNSSGKVVLDWEHNTGALQEEKTTLIDLAAGDYTITEPGIYKIVNANSGANSIIFPAPNLFTGRKITLWNADSNAGANIDTDNGPINGGGIIITGIARGGVQSYDAIASDWIQVSML